MKLKELQNPQQSADQELLVEQQLTEAIVSTDDSVFEPEITAEEMLAQLGITR